MLRLNVILSDYLGRVLLLSDPRVNKLFLPSAQLQPGRLPAATLADSIRLSTGIIALPVRLTGIYADSGSLTLSFRAVQRGGAVTTTDDGQPAAGFFSANPLPQHMTAATRQQLQDAMRHSGGPPVYAPIAMSMGERLRRMLGTSDPQPAGADWEVVVNLASRDSTGEMLWLHETGMTLLRLPSATVPVGTLPSDIARTLARKVAKSTSEPVLSGIYLHPHAPIIEFCYRDGTMYEGHDTERAMPSGDLSDCDPGHVPQAQQALRGVDDLDFAILPEVPATAKGSANYG